MIDKSQILNFKPELQPIGDMKLIVPTSSPTIGNTIVMGSFLKRYLCFKPLYWIEKKIDPQCRIGKPKYKQFAKFVYKVCKWSL